MRFPSGRAIHARSLRRDPAPDPAPHFAVYLLGRRTRAPSEVDWPSQHITWRDFGLPADRAGCIADLIECLDRCGNERVEIGCHGGRGRTGAALAAMAILDGVDPSDAVAWVRRHHHPRAVETPWQRRWVERQRQR
ncbi:MAG: protein phosphatase [Actinomycetota bacterium]